MQKAIIVLLIKMKNESETKSIRVLIKQYQILRNVR